MRTSAHLSFGVGLLLALGRIGLSGMELPCPPVRKRHRRQAHCCRSWRRLILPHATRRSQPRSFSGNVPDFLRKLAPVSVTKRTERGHQPTYLLSDTGLPRSSIGSDYFLGSRRAYASEKIADALHCSCRTRKMVDAVYSRRTGEAYAAADCANPGDDDGAGVQQSQFPGSADADIGYPAPSTWNAHRP